MLFGFVLFAAKSVTAGPAELCVDLVVVALTLVGEDIELEALDALALVDEILVLSGDCGAESPRPALAVKRLLEIIRGEYVRE